jgi:putative peptidoglycan lipid II flippase
VAPRAAGRPARLVGSLAGAAVLVAAVTALSRFAGFGRWLVFARTVGADCVGDVYTTANTIPTVAFEAVAGGALAGAVVPVVASALARGDRVAAARTASALVTWTVIVLVPVALVVTLAAEPLAGFFLGRGSSDGCTGPDATAAGARMLRVFAPQVPAYGLAVVLGGVLQAQRRFLAPALAPLLSSVVVAASYVTFAGLAGADRGDVGALNRGAELVLAGGTTLGVVLLAGSQLPALASGGLRLRPSVRFPPGAAVRARRLAAAGVAALLAQQLAVLVVLRLANAYGAPGSLTLYQYAWALYLLPYAVLAVPLATAAQPLLAERAHVGDRAGYAAATAITARAVVLASAAGAAALAAAAVPISRLFLAGAPGSAPESLSGGALSPGTLVAGLLAFAPGLLGYGLAAHLSRALYVVDRGRDAARALVSGWVCVALVDAALVPLLGAAWVVPALGVGNSVGMLVAAALLVAAVRRGGSAGPQDGRGASEGLRRTAAVAVLGALLAAAVGAGVAALGHVGLPGPGLSGAGAAGSLGSAPRLAGEALLAALAAASALVVLAGCVARADRDTWRDLRRRVGRG